MYTLHKKVFSKAAVKCFSLYRWNKSDSIVFWNAVFGEIQDHGCKATLFLKKLAMEVLCICLPYVKKYLQERQWNVFHFTIQITRTL